MLGDKTSVPFYISATALGSNSAVTIANASTAGLDLNGNSVAVGSLAGGGAAGGNVTLGAGTLTVGGDNTGTTYSGVISGTQATNGCVVPNVPNGSQPLVAIDEQKLGVLSHGSFTVN